MPPQWVTRFPLTLISAHRTPKPEPSAPISFPFSELQEVLDIYSTFMVIFPMKLRSTPRQFTLLALSSEGSLEGFTLSPEGFLAFPPPLGCSHSQKPCILSPACPEYCEGCFASPELRRGVQTLLPVSPSLPFLRKNRGWGTQKRIPAETQAIICTGRGSAPPGINTTTVSNAKELVDRSRATHR